MEKNFKNQTPPRSSTQIDTFMQHQHDASFSPPKFQMANNSPGARHHFTGQDETTASDDRFAASRINIPSSSRTHNQPIDIQNSPRLNVNSLNQNFSNNNNYDTAGVYGETAKTRQNSTSNGNIRLAKNYPEMQNQFFNDLYNNSNSNIKNAMPIFIDDLEEETILDVSVRLLKTAT
jgi:hypothetical protein